METERTAFEHAETAVQVGVEWLRLAIETLGAAVVAVGVVVTAVALVRHAFVDRGDNYRHIRIKFARYLLLALELQLASDILSTAIAPTWDRIGKLAAIAVIRTLLNYFLGREIRDAMRAAGEGSSDAPPDDGSDRRAGRDRDGGSGPDGPRGPNRRGRGDG